MEWDEIEPEVQFAMLWGSIIGLIHSVRNVPDSTQEQFEAAIDGIVSTFGCPPEAIPEIMQEMMEVAINNPEFATQKALECLENDKDFNNAFQRLVEDFK